MPQKKGNTVQNLKNKFQTVLIVFAFRKKIFRKSDKNIMLFFVAILGKRYFKGIFWF